MPVHFDPVAWDESPCTRLCQVAIYERDLIAKALERDKADARLQAKIANHRRGSFPPGRTIRLRQFFRSRYGVGRFDETYPLAVAQAAMSNMAETIYAKLEALRQAHAAFLDAAVQEYEGDGSLAGAWPAHLDATNDLVNLLEAAPLPLRRLDANTSAPSSAAGAARNIDLEAMAQRMVAVETAGDLWKAYSEGKRPCFQSSGIVLSPGSNTPAVQCTDAKAEAKRMALDRAGALVRVEGGDKSAAMEKLMARAQLLAGMDWTSVVNLPLTDFVAIFTENTIATASKNIETTEASALRQTAADAPGSSKGRRKRSTAKGEGQSKLIAALTKHHEYANGGCLNAAPIGNNELAKLAGVSASTASAFFERQFKGHVKYRTMCADKTSLVSALKMLNQEFAPHVLYGIKPPGEREPDDE